jgi:hypothetical protein
MRLFSLILFIILIYSVNSCKISGCTDPRALNYNSKANYDNENSCEYLQSPTLIYPVQNSDIDSNLIRFSWVKQQNVDNYIFDLSVDENFDSIIYSQKQITDTILFIQPIYDGVFFWRVRSTIGKRIISKEGEIRKFKVTSKEKFLKTIEISQVTNNSAKTGGTLLNKINSYIQYGVCWSESENPSLNLNDPSSFTSDYFTSSNEYTSYLNNLKPDTKYYVRSYIRTYYGLIYGDQISFTTTKTKILPTVLTDENVSALTVNSCTVNGTISDSGNDIIIKSGFCYSSTNTSPKINNSNYSNNTVSSSNIITCNLVNLIANTTYYGCAFATNSQGTSYGNVITFNTLSVKVPTLSTSQVTNILSNSAQSGGNNINDGGGLISEYGVCWATTTIQPTLSNSSATTYGSPNASFVQTMNSLLPGTTYYVRAYAKNSAGIGYGNSINFTTSASSTPMILTNGYVSGTLTSSSASISCDLSSIGSSPITSMGVCYSYSSSLPTTSNSKATVSYTALGSYTVKLTGLITKKKYYARAYATNQYGTVYGSVITFTTL